MVTAFIIMTLAVGSLFYMFSEGPCEKAWMDIDDCYKKGNSVVNCQKLYMPKECIKEPEDEWPP